MRQEKRSLRKFARQPCKNILKGTCIELLCDYWHLPDCQFYKSESECQFGTECSFPHWKVEEQPNNSPIPGGGKSAAVKVKDVRQLGCVSQDVEPPDSSAISRKGTQVLEPIRRVRIPRVSLRPANIRANKEPSLNKLQVKLRHQRSPYAVKFEDRSQRAD